MRRSCVITHPVVVNDGKLFEALTSPQSRAGMPTAVGEGPREPQGAAPSQGNSDCFNLM